MSLVHPTAVIYVVHSNDLCRGGLSAELKDASPTADIYVVGQARPALTRDAGNTRDAETATLTPAEAARRLGVARPRIYALVRQGELDDAGGNTLRVTLGSVERRLAAGPPGGEPIKPLGAWAILALASSDAHFARTWRR